MIMYKKFPYTMSEISVNIEVREIPTEKIEVELDKTQSGGPMMRLKVNGKAVWYLYPRGQDEEMVYWSNEGNDAETLDEQPIKATNTIFRY